MFLSDSFYIFALSKNSVQKWWCQPLLLFKEPVRRNKETDESQYWEPQWQDITAIGIAFFQINGNLFLGLIHKYWVEIPQYNNIP